MTYIYIYVCIYLLMHIMIHSRYMYDGYNMYIYLYIYIFIIIHLIMYDIIIILLRLDLCTMEVYLLDLICTHPLWKKSYVIHMYINVQYTQIYNMDVYTWYIIHESYIDDTI